MSLWFQNRDGDLVEVAGRFRIQCGPRCIVNKATEILLDDAVTARHYKEGLMDATGRTIKLGEEMTYLDWRGRKRDPVWRIYEFDHDDEVLMAQGPLRGQKLVQPRWRLVTDHGEWPDKEAALANVLERLGISPRAAMGEQMVFLADRVLDFGINVLNDEADRFDINDSEPTDYTDATSTSSLGNKDHGASGSAFGAPEDGDTSGRKVASTAVTDGSVTATGTATHWSVVEVANTRFLAAQTLSSSQAVTNGNTWAMPSLDVEIPDPS